MSYFEIGEDKTAIAPVPAAPTAPTKTDQPTSFIHKKVVGPVKVWHIGAGVGGAAVLYYVYRMMTRPSYF